MKVPKTYPVHGKVQFKDDTPLTGGSIQLKSLADPSWTTQGEIQPDGTFSLYTLAGKKHLDGALPGQHQVIVVPPQTENQVFQLLKLVHATVTVEPRDNDLTIVVEKVPPGSR